MEFFSKLIFNNDSNYQKFKDYLDSLVICYPNILEFVHCFDKNSKSDCRKLGLLIAVYLYTLKREYDNYEVPVSIEAAQGFFFENLQNCMTLNDLFKNFLYAILKHTKGFEDINMMENVQLTIGILMKLLNDKDLKQFTRLSKTSQKRYFNQIFEKVNELRVLELSSISLSMDKSRQTYDILFKTAPQHHSSDLFEWSIENTRMILSALFTLMEIELPNTQKDTKYDTFMLDNHTSKSFQFQCMASDIYKNIISALGCGYLYLVPTLDTDLSKCFCPLSCHSSLQLSCLKNNQCICDKCESSVIQAPLDLFLGFLFNLTLDKSSSISPNTPTTIHLLDIYNNCIENQLKMSLQSSLCTQTIDKINFRDKSLQTYEKTCTSINTCHDKSASHFVYKQYYTTRQLKS